MLFLLASPQNRNSFVVRQPNLMMKEAEAHLWILIVVDLFELHARFS